VAPRYAVYFVPAARSGLYRFGSSLLGYDCYTGTEIRFPQTLPVAKPAWRELTQEPRRYGFHATLKAPFHLAGGIDEAELVEAFHTFCRSNAVAAVFAPVVAVIEGFVAIVPLASEPAVERLAAACVTAFDRFRAPLNAHDRARRLAAGLSERQAQNFERWGYPYVFEDFRLHLTLTGRLPVERQATVLPFLREQFAAVRGAGAARIDAIALLRQDDSQARFRILSRAIAGGAARWFEAAPRPPRPGQDNSEQNPRDAW
jgi:putative phosphonate metabolism protein